MPRSAVEPRFRTLSLFGFVLAVLLRWSVRVPAQTTLEANDHAAERALFKHLLAQQAQVRTIAEVAMHPSGRSLAYSAQSADGSFRIHVVDLEARGSPTIDITAGADHGCYEGEPRWSADGTELAFLSDCAVSGQLQVYVSKLASGRPSTLQRVTSVTGPISHLHWSPDGTRLSFLYVPDAHRAPNPMAAEGRTVGVIDDQRNLDVQRIAVMDLETRAVALVTPASLYAFEYDWSPDSRDLVYTAAVPPGDDNWYIAKLYRQSLLSQQPRLLFQPKDQIAVPRWSPDGNRIAFIQGLMSDQGGNGGEIFTIPASGDAEPNNLTSGRGSTPSWLAWRPDNTLVFTEFVGGSEAVCTLDPRSRAAARIELLDATAHSSNEETSLSIADRASSLTFATARFGWSSSPEIWLTRGGKEEQVTHLNANVQMSGPRAENLTWISDGFHVQGWLLYPKHFQTDRKYPMLVHAHGGPAWITTPELNEPNFDSNAFTEFGYFVFFPNPRGSYGQGEAFTRANRGDWGYGDLRDILRGIDTVVAHTPVDPARIGLLGWSYGGSTAMFAGTQTGRFRALVAGAGSGDWYSYYGQNSIDQWMRSYFGASPYDDPEAYRRVSALTWIKQTHTPTLVLVGERDGESPPAQSLQFWHALKELSVPTELVIYPDEGHAFTQEEHRIDVMVRTLAWFRRWMPEPFSKPEEHAAPPRPTTVSQ